MPAADAGAFRRSDGRQPRDCRTRCGADLCRCHRRTRRLRSVQESAFPTSRSVKVFWHAQVAKATFTAVSVVKVAFTTLTGCHRDRDHNSDGDGDQRHHYPDVGTSRGVPQPENPCRGRGGSRGKKLGGSISWERGHDAGQAGEHGDLAPAGRTRFQMPLVLRPFGRGKRTQQVGDVPFAVRVRDAVQSPVTPLSRSASRSARRP